MNKQNLHNIEQEIHRKYEKIDKKKKVKMKISGASVKNLSKIIIKKSK